jgi:hypothetical protein
MLNRFAQSVLFRVQLGKLKTELARESAFPKTLAGVITGRIDRLPADQQLMLKVCAVVG